MKLLDPTGSYDNDRVVGCYCSGCGYHRFCTPELTPQPTVWSFVATDPGRGMARGQPDWLASGGGHATSYVQRYRPRNLCLTRNRQPQILPANSPVGPRTTWSAGRICGPTLVRSASVSWIPLEKGAS